VGFLTEEALTWGVDNRGHRPGTVFTGKQYVRVVCGLRVSNEQVRCANRVPPADIKRPSSLIEHDPIIILKRCWILHRVRTKNNYFNFLW